MKNKFYNLGARSKVTVWMIRAFTVHTESLNTTECLNEEQMLDDTLRSMIRLYAFCSEWMAC